MRFWRGATIGEKLCFLLVAFTFLYLAFHVALAASRGTLTGGCQEDMSCQSQQDMGNHCRGDEFTTTTICVD